MDKNTIIAVALSAVVLLASMYIRSKFFPPPPPVQQTAVQQAAEEAPAAAAETEPVFERPAGLEEIQAETSEKIITITTNTARIVFTNRGGDVIDYELLDHRIGNKGIQMADNVSAINRAFSLSFGGAENSIENGLFSVEQPNAYTVQFSKQFTAKNEFGADSSFALVKRYTFTPDEYMFKLDIAFGGRDGMRGLAFGDYGYTLRTSPQIGPPYNVKIDKYERRNFASFTGQKKKQTSVGAGKTGEYKDSYTWTGISGKYFTLLVVPQNPQEMKSVKYSSAIEVNNYANSQLMLQRAPIATASATDTYYIYVGPLTEKTLKTYDNASENAWGLSSLRLDESLNSTGVLSWLEAILKWCLEKINSVVPNWGVTIIILTVLIKLLTFPLTRKSSLASLKMQQVQPRIQELQAKYKDNPTKMNEEMRKIYGESGANPLSGCLPMLIQFPLLIAMFNLFNNYFEFRGSMFIPGWIPDLSVGDSLYVFPFQIPFLGEHLRILPVIYVISQLFSSKLMSLGSASSGASGTQMKIMMYGMPIFFFFILYNAPSGLVIYWTVSNALQLLQQLIINNITKKKRAEMNLAADAKPVFVPRKRKK
jgi:YidC/Oxa1 family membrane protein insertase